MSQIRQYFNDITECTCSSLSWRYRWVCVLDNINPHRTVVEIDPEDGHQYTEQRAIWSLRWLCKLHEAVIERGFQRLYPEDYE